jgi:hypothetical protein
LQILPARRQGAQGVVRVGQALAGAAVLGLADGTAVELAPLARQLRGQVRQADVVAVFQASDADLFID